MGIIIVLGIVFVWLIVGIILLSATGAFKNLSKRNTFLNWFLIICGIISLIFAGGSYIANLSAKKNSGVSSIADGFTIYKYDVKLNVSSDNVVDVLETITVDFTALGHHGIYKFIPEWLEYTGKDGETISRKSTISDLKSLDNPYSLDVVKKKKRIKLGSASETVPLGLKTYTISYKYDMGNDPYEGFDEFIFHAFGDYWGTRIKGATVEVTLPKEFDRQNVKIFNDKYSREDISSQLNTYVLGNTIYISVPEDYRLFKSLTVDVELPEGYFNGGNGSQYGALSLICCLIIIALLVIVIISWIKYGKDLDKEIETVEFYAPDGYDAAEIGYLHKRESGSKLAIAIIVELASKGYIKIDENEDKSVRTITKLAIANEKLEKMSANEKIVYDQLFKNGDTNVLSEDKEFYNIFSEISSKTADNLESKIYDVIAYKKQTSTAILFLISTILFYLAFITFEDLNPKLNILYLIAFVSNIVMVVFVILMGRKSAYGETITARINGFKNYFETAEKEQIEEHANENPNYFYDILPYAYVLGVSKVWISKFENIPVPQSDMGNFDYSGVDSFDSLSSSIYVPVSSSSGCGGGCSSCGGGCSSCGGGGSW